MGEGGPEYFKKKKGESQPEVTRSQTWLWTWAAGSPGYRGKAAATETGPDSKITEQQSPHPYPVSPVTHSSGMQLPPREHEDSQ